MAALVKLMILMASSWSRDQLRSLFQTNLVGEMVSVNSLDSRTNSTLPPSQSLTTLDGSATLVNDASLGPVLWGANKVAASQPIKLWSMPNPPSAQDLPGRLVMQDDGNLVFYSRNNQALWASDTGNPEGASSKLILAGTFDSERPSASSVLLQVYDYSDSRVTSVIYRSN
jgi:L-asparaginase